MASVSQAVSEGQVTFTISVVEKPCSTWYKVIGEVGTVPALIILHGGPGCGHGYVAGLADLNTSIGASVVLYDQIGCGRSTRFRPGFNILGHSWGGTLGGAYATTQPEEFNKAAAVAKHVCRLDPMPEEIAKSYENVKEDPTAYVTIGSQEAHKIEAETLLLNGRHDEVQDIAMYPWFNAIPKVKWMTIEDASHLGHVENKERFLEICSELLSQN
ncbi:proline-specific peptidase [Xylariaceae sp. FL1272]|nr:proline-specific peptidase [Xylariaceae sp. FL1272]